MRGAPIPLPVRGTGTCTVAVVARYVAAGYIRLSRIWAESGNVSGDTRSVDGWPADPVADTSVTPYRRHNCHQAAHRFGRWAVPVGQFLDHRTHRVVVGRGRQPAVTLQPQPVAGDVLRWQVRVDRQVDPHVLGFRRAGDGVTVGGRAICFNGLADQPHIEVEADTRDVPGLFDAQHIAGAADFEVLHRHGHPGAEFVVLRDRGQPVVGRLGQRKYA